MEHATKVVTGIGGSTSSGISSSSGVTTTPATDGFGRSFGSGATRDTSEGKLCYAGFFSSIVLRAFAEYMHKHRLSTDGTTYRDPDNWKNLFGEQHEDVCMDSLWRHFMDLYLLHEGYEGREGIKDALCGILFNTQAYLYKILDEEAKDATDAVPMKGSDFTYPLTVTVPAWVPPVTPSIPTVTPSIPMPWILPSDHTGVVGPWWWTGTSWTTCANGAGHAK